MCFAGNKKVAARFVVTLGTTSEFLLRLPTKQATYGNACSMHQKVLFCTYGKATWFPKTWKEELMSHALGIFWVGYQQQSCLLHTSHTGDRSCTLGRMPGWGFTGKEVPADWMPRLLQSNVCGLFWKWQTPCRGKDTGRLRSSYISWEISFSLIIKHYWFVYLIFCSERVTLTGMMTLTLARLEKLLEIRY